jgi:hypothetical protein
MKPLGYSKMINFGYEDLADIYCYGSPSSKSHIRKHREVKNSFRSPSQKYKSRRYYKRFERFTNNQLKEINGNISRYNNAI